MPLACSTFPLLVWSTFAFTCTSFCRFSYLFKAPHVAPGRSISVEVELYAQNKYDQKAVFGFHLSFNIYWLFLRRLHGELGYLGLEIFREGEQDVSLKECREL